MLATNCAEKCSKTLEIHRFFDDGDQKSYKFIWFFNTIDRECSVYMHSDFLNFLSVGLGEKRAIDWDFRPLSNSETIFSKMFQVEVHDPDTNKIFIGTWSDAFPKHMRLPSGALQARSTHHYCNRFAL